MTPFLRPLPIRWGVLIALSALLVGGAEMARLPAAFLLGPMVAAVGVAALDAPVRLPGFPYIVAQGMLGLVIAHALTPDLFVEMADDWPLFALAVFWVIAAACLLGWILSRRRVLPDTTAVWGSFPGAATVMTLMAEDYGADVRLVAFMQYYRVLLVVFVASLIARIWTGGGGTGAGGAGLDLFPTLPWAEVAKTAAFAGAAGLIGSRLRFPVAAMLLPALLAFLLQAFTGYRFVLPPWLLAAAYTLIGWSIGLRFTQAILRHALRSLPRVTAAILALIALCGVFAAALVHWAGVDPLTAYLATSPGGVDSVAVIASSASVDLPFVMALQAARFLAVLLLGPSLARFIAGHLGEA